MENLEYRANVGGGMVEHEIVDLFVIHCYTLTTLALNPDEVQAVRWVILTELETEIAKSPNAVTPWLRIYLRDYKASVLGPA